MARYRIVRTRIGFTWERQNEWLPFLWARWVQSFKTIELAEADAREAADCEYRSKRVGQVVKDLGEL